MSLHDLCSASIEERVPARPNAAVAAAATIGDGRAVVTQMRWAPVPPTYSLTVTLFSLLTFSGLPSFLSERYSDRRDQALAAPLCSLAILTIFYQFGVPAIVEASAGASVLVRVAMTIAFLAPLGLVLGAFLPIGLTTISRVTERQREFIAWGWAVNGFSSVISSVLSTILSMSLGFTPANPCMWSEWRFSSGFLPLRARRHSLPPWPR